MCIKVFKTINPFRVPKKDQRPVCTRWNFLLLAEKEGEKGNLDAHPLGAKNGKGIEK